MNENPLISGSDVVCALVDAGFHVEASSSSHVLLEKEVLLVLVPVSPLDPLTLRRVLKAAVITDLDLRDHLRKVRLRSA